MFSLVRLPSATRTNPWAVSAMNS